MKKIFSNIWNLIKRHKILTFICTIAIILIIIMTVVLFSFFVGENDKYGNRLDGIKKVEVTSKDKKEITEALDEFEEVTDVSVRVQGKIIYINIKFKEGTKIDKAKEIANKSLKNIDEDQLKFYDLGYFLTSEGKDKFNITGTFSSGKAINFKSGWYTKTKK